MIAALLFLMLLQNSNLLRSSVIFYLSSFTISGRGLYLTQTSNSSPTYKLCGAILSGDTARPALGWYTQRGAP
ncbi:hypothetical protein IW261DRAFT_1491793 [Armillaria novae-zelandiae]|uniref:Secreted protein n=1 Tax=Armillaria novae-zelandiae TaxID=153914 RepID=A0AA39UBA7_9AGAR|nr:hypothetical protein IW261DRAFT_1491793 [Armillaria novae-zelandiae]